MVNPLYIIAAGLAAAFVLGMLPRRETLAATLAVVLLAAFTAVSASWLSAFFWGGAEAVQFFTAGSRPPFSIALQVGAHEAFFALAVNLVALLSGVYLFDTLRRRGTHAISVFIVLVVGLNGVILTRDLFNLFVFLEVASIATAGLIVVGSDVRPLSAGFKYMIATGIISGFLLLGIIFIYFFGGSLSIDLLVAANLNATKAGAIALFLVVIALVFELKPFPANGWAIDVYEAAPAGINALLSAASTAAAYFALAKVLPMAGDAFARFVAVAGAVTFLGSSVMGVRQENAKRLLGYSSVGQMGLLLVVLGLGESLGAARDVVAAGLFLTHYLAKAILFWLAGIVGRDGIRSWAALRANPVLMVLFGSTVFALVGFPPFPSFFAKWDLVLLLTASDAIGMAAIVLLASFVEAVYLFRWFGYALKLDRDGSEELAAPLHRVVPPVVFGILLYLAAWYFGHATATFGAIHFVPLAFVAALALLDWLPVWIKNTLAIAGTSAYIVWLYPQVEGDLFRVIFGAIFLVGAVLTLLSGYYQSGRRVGFYPMAMTMFAGLAMLITADNLMELFYGWELMTIGSYFLLIRGKKSMPHGYSYVLFSVGGSFGMLLGFALAAASAGHIGLDALSDITVYPMVAYALMLLGFMTKTASVPMHIWLPGAHGEAVADIHFMASAILLKAGVFGMVIVLLGMGAEAAYARTILLVLSWIGVISALAGNITAAMQESAKRLLAWSSIGQLGYIVFALATMTHLGWLMAMTYSLTHFLYKGILFLIVGGIAWHLGTADMYRMGGLIKRMPFSFFAVLIAIITLSGVPPLVGFAAKWITYNIMISEGFVLQGAVLVISGIIAFLYLFRLIHAIFLGQLKDNLRRVKEINVWFLIPVYILIAAIFYLSLTPAALLRPIGTAMTQYFPDGALVWDGNLATTAIGYFDGEVIMYVISGIFALVLLFFVLITLRKNMQPVKQFNIFYAGEQPSRPELAHVSYNFFAHYRRAIGFLMVPLVERFWRWTGESLHGFAEFVRRVYNGNGQSYAFHLVLYFVVVFLIQAGGM